MKKNKTLVIQPELCKGCGICIAFCPKKALEFHKQKAVLKENNECILCGMCELRCPDYAIYLKEEE